MFTNRLSFLFVLFLFVVISLIVDSGFAQTTDESEIQNETTIRVISEDEKGATFNAFFYTESDTLISEKSIEAPKIFRISETNFTGFIQPLDGATLKVFKGMNGVFSFSGPSDEPVRITRKGEDLSSSFIDPEDLPEGLR